MINFLLQLVFGSKVVPKKYQPIFSRLQSLKCLNYHGGIYRLDSKFVFGIIDFKRSNAMFLSDIAKKQEYFVASRGISCHRGDIVIGKIIKQRGKETVKILDVLRSCDRFLCYLDLYKGSIVGYKLYEEKRRPINLPIPQKSLRQLPRYCVIYIDMKTKKILEILGVLDDVQIDERMIMLHYNHPEGFSKESVAYAESFGKEVDKTLYPHRIDLTHLPFYTIDPSSARDHDDAIYYDSKQKVLYVAIADVSEYVAMDSPIDIEARERGFSLYFPHKSHPMLPRNLSENICSLKEGEDRLAFVWAIEFDKTYEIKESCLFEAVICNHQNITYEAVDLCLEGKKHHIKTEIAKNIKSFYEVAKKLNQKRMLHGYNFLSSEVTLELDENFSLKNTRCYKETLSHMVVEEAMLLANQEAAKMIKECTKGIFRVHAPIKEERKQMLFFELKALGFAIRGKNFHEQILDIQKQALQSNKKQEIDQMIIKAQSKAQYASKAQEHFALGFEFYTHFTSPIRRYSDLFLHRILKAILQNHRQIDFLMSHADMLCAFLNDQERKIAKMEISFKDRKFAHWALQNQGRIIAARVVDTHYPVLAMALEEIISARLIVEECDEVELFENILVEIIDVDLSNARIYTKFKGFEKKDV